MGTELGEYLGREEIETPVLPKNMIEHIAPIPGLINESVQSLLTMPEVKVHFPHPKQFEYSIDTYSFQFCVTQDVLHILNVTKGISPSSATKSHNMCYQPWLSPVDPLSTLLSDDSR